MSDGNGRSYKKQNNSRILIRITIGFILVFAIASAVAIYFDQESQMARILARQAALESDLADSEDTLADLQDLQSIVDTDAYIERIAREQLGMVKPNEIIFED